MVAYDSLSTTDEKKELLMKHKKSAGMRQVPGMPLKSYCYFPRCVTRPQSELRLERVSIMFFNTTLEANALFLVDI